MLIVGRHQCRFRSLELSERDIIQTSSKLVRKLTKERVDPCQAFGKQLVHTVLDGFSLYRMLYTHTRPAAAQYANTAFALFETGRIQGRSRLISVRSRCRFNPSLAASVPRSKAEFTTPHHLLQLFARYGPEATSSITPECCPPA